MTKMSLKVGYGSDLSISPIKSMATIFLAIFCRLIIGISALKNRHLERFEGVFCPTDLSADIAVIADNKGTVFI